MQESVARKHRMSAEGRRAAIVEAAVRLFAEKGFRGTTTRELAAAVGVTEPVLYQHFATKRELYHAIIESICEGGEDRRDEALEAARLAGDDRAFFSRLAELLLDWYETRPEVIRLLLYSALEKHELKDMFFERQMVVYYRLLTDYISRRQEAGDFLAVNPYAAARIFTGMVSHHGLVKTVFGRDDLAATRREFVEGTVTIFLAGIRQSRTKSR
jgi:AcrR family transcriptional regulator